jgi:hypothetical protein
VFINFAKIDFNCPHCNKEYLDLDDKYLNRCNKNKSCCTTITCECENKFGFTYNYRGDAVSFKLERDEKVI